MDAIQELRVRAEILHKRLGAGYQRKDCLGMIAAEFGFPNWPAAKAAISGGEAVDFGTLLYPSASAHINLWFARYDEAAEVRAAQQGCLERPGRHYLLGYKKQFLVVDRYFIESLGLDPDDEDWHEIGYDWIRPKDPVARTRLYGKLIALRRLPAC
jgi:hypothetical protein